ncbi:ribokinase [Deinococcus hopiensis]|uniref:Ribokinase n=1 Tax=Deinococcus hopiensis KR-140 TaxID=695939 RepID=A0A1W1UDE9_9DEIO|nr:ribokinase [Deinococcus hopiensis]SMB79063.1 ribokinase [Deinococcus hopiensis KR-140]
MVPVILVAGSANLDLTVAVPHIVRPGETVIGGDTVTAPGGKGANQAVAAGRAGGRVTFLGALGRDAAGQTLLSSLQEVGVDTACVQLVDAPTGAAYISVTPEGENAITVSSGANAHLLPEHLPDLTPFTHLLLQLETPPETVSAFAQAGHAAGLSVVLNAAPARPLDEQLLRHVSVLVVNEGELQTLAGEEGGTEAQAARLRARGPQTVVVTLGAQGCLAQTAGSTIRLPAFRVEVTDTTGAGDTFVGVLAAWLSQGAPLEGALQAATVGAALACTQPGAQPGMPTRAAILAHLTR